jgi:predicted enzyme related to lactoylglutathione lyase
MTYHGIFHWNELNTRDVEKAKAFYAQTIGWTYQGMPMGGGTYWVAMVGDNMAGGIFDMNAMGIPKEVPEHWMSYLAVDDIDKRLAEAKKAGATVLREPFEVSGTGRIAILKEPGGAVVGWMTPAPM